MLGWWRAGVCQVYGPYPLLLCSPSRQVGCPSRPCVHSQARPALRHFLSSGTRPAWCASEGGSLSRGKDTLFRRDCLPGLRVPCPRSGGQSKELPTGGSQRAGRGGGSGEGRRARLCVPDCAMTPAPLRDPLRPSLPSTILPVLLSPPTSLVEFSTHSIHLFIH